MKEFELQGLRAARQRALEVAYKGAPVGLYVAEILVKDRVVVELKVVEALAKAHEAQLLNYLEACGKKVGLVNFKHPKAEIRRFVL